MAMSRKDYVVIAAVFKDRIPTKIETVHDALKDRERFALAKDLAFQFNLKCPGFDSGKFMAACGYPDPKGG